MQTLKKLSFLSLPTPNRPSHTWVQFDVGHRTCLDPRSPDSICPLSVDTGESTLCLLGSLVACLTLGSRSWSEERRGQIILRGVAFLGRSLSKLLTGEPGQEGGNNG